MTKGHPNESGEIRKNFFLLPALLNYSRLFPGSELNRQKLPQRPPQKRRLVHRVNARLVLRLGDHEQCFPYADCKTKKRYSKGSLF